MNRKLRLACLAACLAALLPGASYAQVIDKNLCTHDDLTRRVEIFYETSDGIPCEVRYHKDTEMPGVYQLLWSAKTQAGFCERKTREFISRLESWGWQCSKGADVAQNINNEQLPVDDTDALTPADDIELEEE